jgi:hypothetical protein
VNEVEVEKANGEREKKETGLERKEKRKAAR